MLLTAWQRFAYSITGWRGFKYPDTPKLPPKPWHPDGDELVTMRPQMRHPDSAMFIGHLARTGTLVISTGSTVPNRQGMVNGYPLNAGYATDGLLTISKTPGNGLLHVDTGYSSSYGARVRYGKRMIVQGEPMVGYSDSKLHVFDVSGPSYHITEVQNFRERLGGYACDGATQYGLDIPSTQAQGRSAAKLPLAEHTLRYENLMLQGWRQRASMGVRAARHTFIAPAQGSDGPVGRVGSGPFDSMPDDPAAPPMGIVLVLKQSFLDRMMSEGITPLTNPQAWAVMECYSEYGIIIVDTGGNNGTHLEPDNRWDQADLSVLKKIGMSDFECWTLFDRDTYDAIYRRDF